MSLIITVSSVLCSTQFHINTYFLKMFICFVTVRISHSLLYWVRYLTALRYMFFNLTRENTYCERHQVSILRVRILKHQKSRRSRMKISTRLTPTPASQLQLEGPRAEMQHGRRNSLCRNDQTCNSLHQRISVAPYHSTKVHGIVVQPAPSVLHLAAVECKAPLAPR